MKVIELIAKYKKKVAFHIGADSPVFTNPDRVGNIAGLFPETDVFAIHMGGSSEPDVSDHMIEVAKNYPNVLLVGSSIAKSSVANAIRILGPERVAFGSDTPYRGRAKEHLDEYREMLKEFDERTTELVLGGNAKRVFGL